MIRVDKKGRIRREAVECPIVDHCNLACDGCDHGSPFLPERYRAVDRFQKDVTALARALSVKTLKIVGGEPLLHKQLGDIVEAAKTSGLADEVEVWTNGLLLHKLDDRVLGTIDGLRITSYPGVALRYDLAKLKEQSKRLGFRWSVEHTAEFCQCFPEDKIEDEKRVQKIFADCKNAHAWSCHSFLDGYYYKCSRADYIRKQLELDGLEVDEFMGDGVSLDRPDLRVALERYLEDRTPLAACHWCLGTSGPSFPQKQLPRNRREWSQLPTLHKVGRRLPIVT